MIDVEAGRGVAPLTPRLRLESLTKTFNAHPAIRDLSLTIASGEIYGLIGPNGSGKTTTVKLTTGLYRPTAGRIVVGGVDLSREPERAKRRLGYVPDEPFTYERMTGREFLSLVGELWGVAREVCARRMAELATTFRLEEILDSQAETYSRGNRQKLALIAALLHAPGLLMIDEPIVGLDPESSVCARDVLRAYATEGGGVLLCTHTLSFAEAVCHRVGLLRDGVLVAEGDLEALRARAGVADASLESLYLQLAARR